MLDPQATYLYESSSLEEYCDVVHVQRETL